MPQTADGERIVKLMLFIRENGPVSLSSIRQHLSYEYGKHAGSEPSTRRRFERDKKTLQDCGVFLEVDERGYYSLDAAKSFAAPLSLAQPQVSMLRLLCGALLEDSDYPFKEDLRMVLVKLGDELDVPDMLPQMRGGSDLGRTAEPQGLAKVKKAITNRRRLSFEYEGAAGARSSREVEPFGCFFLKSACYVVAFDPSAGGERCFRIDRMRKIKLNNSGPGTPDFEARVFDASKYYGLPFQFGDESCMARIHIDESEAPRIRRAAMGQGSFEEDDDEVIWTVACKDPDMLARWCIENSPGLRIIEPECASRTYISGLEYFLANLNAEEASA